MPGPQGTRRAPTMNLGKLSVGWVSDAPGKRRLTADMISPPLGDFRHTMHVGRGGDVFGDTSFLSNHGGSSGGTHRSPRSFLARKLQLVRRVGVPPRRVASPPAPSPAPPAVSPIIKNAISLPQLNHVAYDSLVVGKLSFDSSPRGSRDGTSSYGLESGFCTISRLPRTEKPRDRDLDRNRERERESTFPSEPELRRSDSLQSFRLDLDLGPSLLSELLGVMSLSEAPAAGTPTPVPVMTPATPTTNPPAPAINSPASVTNPSSGHYPNGVTAGSGTEMRPKAAPEGPNAPADMAPSRRWGASHHYTATDARWEQVEAPQVRASWESLDEEWGVQAGSRAPVPSTVQANAFVFADAEEDDEVKV
ncbi:PREDICTED: cdc42 effector protein 1 [Elephantulus edwardii]|uniref:cdc42 effector protein 1 n=1 Tax=Elephantulus edwardii TaxID=28737 RepID=UPI0003F095B4|nr:PREDICTED: cdc42 effector protein 1 [Elephantulus edwardii]